PLQLQLFIVWRAGRELLNRPCRGREQYGLVAGEVADDRRDAADGEREERTDRKDAGARFEQEAVESGADEKEERDEGEHDQPRLSTVAGLLLVEIHR